jgi:phenylacetate-CoA ligase
MALRSRFYLLCTRTAMGNYHHISRQIATFEPRRTDDYLRALLRHAAAHVPYYASLPVGDADWRAQFDDLRPLTKRLIRENFDRLKSDDIVRRRCALTSSGGSTGQPITLLQDAECHPWSFLTEQFFWKYMLGIEYGSAPTVVIWGSERDLFGERQRLKSRLRNRILQTTFLNSFKMAEADLYRYVQAVCEKKPMVIKGYAGSLYQLARHVRRNNLRIHQPKVIYSAAETLRPFMRTLIEEVFGCKVHDFYGSREVGAIAGECVEGKMHLFSFNNFSEVVDADNCPVQPGQEGRLLVTTLHNYAMPLLRYDIGDTAVLGTACACGIELPTLHRVVGRLTDHFCTSQGALVHGEYFTHLFYFKDWVREFHVLQRELDLIEVYYVPGAAAVDADMADINRKIRLVMGADCHIEWHAVDSVPRTPQGKLLFTRSLVHAE